MRRIRTMGLCLVAAFAISAVATATASAVGEPEFYSSSNTCTKKFGHLAYTGECGAATKPQSISYTENGGVANLEGGLKIECKTNTGKGKIEGGKGGSEQKANIVSKLKITYKECVETGTSKECTKTFSVPGTIVTEGIKGKLVKASETSGGTQIVGQELEPESATKGFANFKCGTSTNFITVKVQGHIIIEATPGPGGKGGVVATPDSTKVATEGGTANKEKALIAGCGHQQLLYVNGGGACQFLKVVENGTELEPSWNIATNEVKYGTKKVEAVEKGEF